MAFMVRLELLLSSFLLLFLVSCGVEMPSDPIPFTYEGVTKTKGIYYYQGEPFTGTFIEIISSGDTSIIEEYVDGKKNGTSKVWWPLGVLKFEAHYQDGLYQGQVSEWYVDGQPYSVFNYDKGYEAGKQIAWKSDGRIKANYEVINGRKYGLTGVKNCINVFEE